MSRWAYSPTSLDRRASAKAGSLGSRRKGALWWKKTVELCGETGWASAFDREHLEIACKPALELAGITRSVTVNIPGIAAGESRRSGCTTCEFEGLFEKNGTRILNLKVTLADGKDISRVWSSHCGELQLRREGASVAIVPPIEYADVLIFAREPKTSNQKDGIKKK
ncbi:MAG: hypothetical protein WCS96_03555 [Victivallales bacterium]